MDMTFRIKGLDCANCGAKIEREIRKYPEVTEASLDFMQMKLRISTSDPIKEAVFKKSLQERISRIEPSVRIEKDLPKDKDSSNAKEHEMRVRRLVILSGTVLFLLGIAAEYFLSFPRVAEFLFIGSYFFTGLPVLWTAARNLRVRKMLDENILMSIATIGAFAISQSSEAAAVMLFYQIGVYFEQKALQSSRRSISEVLALRPDYANILVEDALVRVSPETLSVGDEFIVKPGERVPLDGIVLTGESYLDMSALTGEPVPSWVGPKSVVLSGSVNQESVLAIRATTTSSESTASRIIEMVSGAGAKKTVRENQITRFAAIYTPVVVSMAILLAVIPPLFFGQSFATWIYRALSFLVISCPCALVISVPLGYFGGMGAASRNGILIKGSSYLDALAEVTRIVFDKTGTLTEGVFAVTEIGAQKGFSEDDVLVLAALAEKYSNHPIAVSVRNAAERIPVQPDSPPPETYTEIPGRGVRVAVPDNEILVGNLAFMEEAKIEGVTAEGSSSAVLYVATNRKYAGYLIISDRIKASAKDAVSFLREKESCEIAMLTGDRNAAAAAVAAELGIKKVYSELLPEGKLEQLEKFLQVPIDTKKGKKGTTLFVGDGMNDAPVLARADVGITIGVNASGAAVESADVVILSSDLTGLNKSIRIAKKTVRIVSENIALALIVKGVILVLASLGITHLWSAIFADVGVSLLAILNAIRAGKF